MPPLALLATARAPLAAFAAMGALWGGFAATLPDLKAMLGVSEGTLGLMLLGTPLAGVAAMLVAARAGSALGRLALPLAVSAMAAAFALPGHLAAPALFVLALLACGATTGLLDVLMNARVAALEAARGAHLMNLCHAGYSLGYGLSAIMVGVLRAEGLPPGIVMSAPAGLGLILALVAIERDGRIEGLRRPARGAGSGLGIVPLIGGAVVLIAFMSEHAAEAWSALHIEKTLGGSPAEGAMGPATIALTMAAARLAGQGLIARISAVRLLIGGAAISATGALVAAAATGPAMAYSGFVVMGIGSSVIAPTAFSLVGRLARPEARARAIARATLIGYFGYFFGPPTLGLIAEVVGLRGAFVFAAVALGFVPLLAWLLGRRGA
ncbi:MAG: MFS transporter [Alphaproteobacteria bacterium]|nr:MFS transporter [Alphaproteobacteria bacterium]